MLSNPVDFLPLLIVTLAGMIVTVVRKDWGMFGVFAVLGLIGSIGFIYRFLGGA